MKCYTHLTSEQRYQISNGLKEGYSQTAIADIIGVNKSTISREIRRNGPNLGRVKRRIAGAGAYGPVGAHKQALARRVGKSKVRISREDWQLIEGLLHEKWSPEQLSLWLGKAGRMAVSHEWIYSYIRKDKYHGGLLYKHLRCRKKWKKRYGSKARPALHLSDKHSIFRVNYPDKEGELSQFTRALKTLDIEPIHANTPPAKGRVERANKTLQDRLVKEMLLRSIRSIEPANALLPQFIDDYNRRFAVPADYPEQIQMAAQAAGLMTGFPGKPENDGAALTGWCFTTDPTRHWHENAESGTIRHKLPGCTSRLKPSADDTPC